MPLRELLLKSEENPTEKKLYLFSDNLAVSFDSFPLKTVRLSDGTRLQHGQPFGKLQVLGQKITPNENLAPYIRQLRTGVEQGLINLAIECQNDNKLFQGITVFGGFSHLGDIAGEWGFDVYPIYDGEYEEYATYNSRMYVTRLVGENRYWQTLQKRSRELHAKATLISRDALINRYGVSGNNS